MLDVIAMYECIDDVDNRRISALAIIDLPSQIVDEAQEIYEHRQERGDDVDAQDLLMEHVKLEPVFLAEGDEIDFYEE